MKDESIHAIKHFLKKQGRILYWIAPPILLIIIFSRIDIDQFVQTFSNANPWLIVFGIGYYPLIILIAGFRWHVALTQYFNIKLGLPYLLRHYWIGMSMGVFSPGQLGWDAYRVVVVGRRCGRYIQNFLVIIVEKLMALLNAVIMVVCMFPLIDQHIVVNSPLLPRILNFSYLVLFGSIFALLLILTFTHNRVQGLIANRVTSMTEGLQSKLKGKTNSSFLSTTNVGEVKSIMAGMMRPSPFIQVLLVSFAIQFAAAIGNQILFRAVGYEIPLIVNLFVLPIFYFVFLLPVSFGSVGIREGAYIALYGMFGVPAEVALVVSFLNLAGMLLNYTIGAIIIYTVRPTWIKD